METPSFRLRYNILRDGDNNLKGKIAEEVVKNLLRRSLLCKILKTKGLKCCSTADLKGLFIYFAYKKSITTHLGQLEDVLEEVRKGGDPISEVIRKLSKELEDTRSLIREYGRKIGFKTIKCATSINECFICGEEIKQERIYDETFKTYLVKMRGHVIHYDIRLCERCYEFYEKIVEDKQVNFLKLLKRFAVLHHDFVDLKNVLQLDNTLKVLSYLDKEDLTFLREYYGAGKLGSPSLDVLCVSDDSEKYLIEVKSSSKYLKPSLSLLSKKEQIVAKEAKKRGFKILLATVRFGGNWNVIIELCSV